MDSYEVRFPLEKIKKFLFAYSNRWLYAPCQLHPVLYEINFLWAKFLKKNWRCCIVSDQQYSFGLLVHSKFQLWPTVQNPHHRMLLLKTDEVTRSEGIFELERYYSCTSENVQIMSLHQRIMICQRTHMSMITEPVRTHALHFESATLIE